MRKYQSNKFSEEKNIDNRHYSGSQLLLLRSKPTDIRLNWKYCFQESSTLNSNKWCSRIVAIKKNINTSSLALKEIAFAVKYNQRIRTSIQANGNVTIKVAGVNGEHPIRSIMYDIVPTVNPICLGQRFAVGVRPVGLTLYWTRRVVHRRNLCNLSCPFVYCLSLIHI